jgi:tRNA/tmRNA/rRNA uracil-C5-methylase (TrmA/RlmC/RlmD family)
MGVHEGSRIELDVTGIAHGGVAVARHDGRVVFVADAIPGERVVARVSDDRKASFWRAETVEVLEPSADRVEHVWREAAIDRDPARRAGGAEFGHILLARQRALKTEVLVDSLRRFGKIDREVEVEAVPGDDERNGLGWRTRVRLHVGDDGRPGPVAARSHRVIPVSSLPLAAEVITDSGILGDAFTGVTSIDAIATADGGVRLVIGEQRPTPMTERVGDREFRVDDTGFWQVHHGAAAVLTEAVQAAVDPDRFDPSADNLDLYGGVGLLAAAVADRFGPSTRIVSVESDARAVDHASDNLAEWVGARAETGRVDRWLRERLASGSVAGADRATVVLDPPRSGAGGEVIRDLVRLGPAQLVYVACDPVAFARDAGTLAAAGYELDALRAFDLFPHTHHVEAVARFVRV